MTSTMSMLPPNSSTILRPTDNVTSSTSSVSRIGSSDNLPTVTLSSKRGGSYYSLYLWGYKDKRSDNDDDDDDRKQEELPIGQCLVANGNVSKNGGGSSAIPTLTECLEDHNNNNIYNNNYYYDLRGGEQQSSITMLHLRAIDNINRSSRESFQRFLMHHPTCRKVWLENCIVLANSSSSNNKNAYDAILHLLVSLLHVVVAVPSSTTATAATATATATGATRPIISHPTKLKNGSDYQNSIQHHDPTTRTACVDEFILEGPSLTNDWLEAIVTSLASPACSLQKLTIQQWERDPNDDHVDNINSDESKNECNLLSTSIPYRLIQLQQDQQGAAGLRHVTLRGLQLVQPSTATTAGTIAAAAAATTSTTPWIDFWDVARNGSTSSNSNNNNNVNITSWDVSGCYFPHNDSSHFLCTLLNDCPQLRFLRIDGNDILGMYQHQQQQQQQSSTHPVVQTLLASLFQRLHSLDLSWEDSKVQRHPETRQWQQHPPLLPDTVDDDAARLAQIVGDALSAAASSSVSCSTTRPIETTATSCNNNDHHRNPHQGLTQLRLCRNFWSINDLVRLFFGTGSWRKNDPEDEQELPQQQHRQACVAFSLSSLSLPSPTLLTQTITCTLSTLQVLDLTCCNIIAPRLLWILQSLIPQLSRLQKLYLGYNPIFQSQDQDDFDDDDYDDNHHLDHDDDAVMDEDDFVILPIINVNGTQRQRKFLLSAMLESVRVHPCLDLISLEGIDDIPVDVSTLLIYYTSIKRCHCGGGSGGDSFRRYHQSPARCTESKQFEVSMMTGSSAEGLNARMEKGVTARESAPHTNPAAFLNQHDVRPRALWPFVLDHCRFEDYNDIGIMLKSTHRRTNGSCLDIDNNGESDDDEEDDNNNNSNIDYDCFPSRRAQAEAIYHLLQQGGCFLDDVILSRPAQ
jgi:hypothetical protein